jgi:hypothetical protein
MLNLCATTYLQYQLIAVISIGALNKSNKRFSFLQVAEGWLKHTERLR